MYVLNFLRSKLASKILRVQVRYKQYEQKKFDPPLGVVIPPELSQRYRAVSGWCAKAVDALADRLIYRGVSDDIFDLTTVFTDNNPDIFFDSAILSALIASCSFVYISPADDSDVSGYFTEDSLRSLTGIKGVGQ